MNPITEFLHDTADTMIDNYVEVSNDRYKVTLGFAGEGYYGEYDDEDPEDEPLLRATLYEKEDSETGYEDVAASICTLESACISLWQGKRIANKIFDIFMHENTDQSAEYRFSYAVNQETE